MQNTIAAQLNALGFELNGGDWTLEWSSDYGANIVRMVATFTEDDGTWFGNLRVKYEGYLEDWDGEQPIDNWIVRVERAYWDV